MARRVDIKYVREHCDFAAVLAHYEVVLRGKGPQRTALCPFHRERKGSFNVNLERRLFHCFGCEAKGNVIDFVMEMDGVDARKAAITIAEICSMETVPPGDERPQRKGKRKSTKKAKQADASAPADEAPAEPSADEEAEAEQPEPTENEPLGFELKLDPEHPYLTTRASEAIVTTFGLGFCSRGMMKGRIAIPIHNAKGDLLAYAGRWAEAEPPDDVARYLLPKQFHKQLELFNIHRLPESATAAVLVESYWSVFRLHELGIPTVSPMGHAISEMQIALLLGRGITYITVLFDGDKAGYLGNEKAVPELARHCFVHAPEVPSGFKPHQADEALIKKLVGGR